MPVNEIEQEHPDQNSDPSVEIKALEQKWLNKNRQVQPPPAPGASADPESDT